LRRAGLKTIGAVAGRSPAEITARFGASFTALLGQALGRCDTPISPRRPLPDFVAEQRFAEPVMTERIISATLASLTNRLAVLMQRNGKGARLIEAAFFRTDGAVRLIAVAAGRPTRDPDAIGRLFREKLDALTDPLDPGFGFDLIRLSASHLDDVSEQQDNFDSQQSERADFDALVDRLSTRFGLRRIVRYLAQDTHIPEQVALAVPAQRHAASSVAWPGRPHGEKPRRPVRLFERPEPISVIAEVPEGPPARFKWRNTSHVVARAEGPERIAMEWWRDAGRALTRDYFRVEDNAGLRFWIYREGLYERELAKPGEHPRWFMHGLFA
jgi:protein ImuB